MIDVIEKHESKDKVSVPPAKKWRNKYCSKEPAPFGVPTEYTKGPGDWFGTNIFPSKDVAETVAERLLTDWRLWADAYGVKFVCSVPEE